MIGSFIPFGDRARVGWIVQENGCHGWTGTRSQSGYGRVKYLGKMRRAHAVRYEREIGPIPPGLELDHLCSNPSCGNPAHLEPVTHSENMRRGLNNPFGINARKTHCKRGHPLSGSNIVGRGGRRCRVCKVALNRSYRHANA